MALKTKKYLNACILSSLMLLNQHNFSEKAYFNSFFSKKESERVINKELVDINHIKLMNNVLLNKDYASVDSVIKFVPKEVLKNYVDLNKKVFHSFSKNTNFNKLEALTKSGEEIAYDRFNFPGNKDRSLENYVDHLGITLGSFGSRNEAKNFLSLYREDIESAALKNDLDPYLLAALAIHESRGRTFTASNTGALGPLGLTNRIYNPRHAWSDGVEREPINPFYVPDALFRAADFFSLLVSNYEHIDDTNTLALVAYNQGESVVNRAIRLANKDINPLNLINYKDVLNAKRTESFSDVLRQSDKPRYFIAEQGRTYPGKILKEAQRVRSLLENRFN